MVAVVVVINLFVLNICFVVTLFSLLLSQTKSIEWHTHLCNDIKKWHFLHDSQGM